MKWCTGKILILNILMNKAAMLALERALSELLWEVEIKFYIY